MRHLRTIFITMAAIFLVCVAETRADSLQLKNGNFVQGKYLGGTERALQFEVNGKIRMYDIEEILSISFAAASADGGIPSNNADPKPNENTDLNSAATGNGELRTAFSKRTNTRNVFAKQIARQTVHQQGSYGGGREPLAERPAETSGSNCAIKANSDAKADVSRAAARYVRISSRRLPVLAD